VADADPTGRLRLDAVARFVQDVGNDDVADAGLDPNIPWVIRRSEVSIDGWPRLGERVGIATWCGGTGSRWAERRVTFSTPSGTIDVATLVVHLDGQGRPARLPAWFDEVYAPAALGRTLTSRLVLSGPPADAGGRPWPLRSVDLDVLGHVNNAVTWAAVEDECSRRGTLPSAVTVEWSGALEATDDVVLRATPTGLWLEVDEVVRVTAAVQSSASSR
jgi:acyl-ACP thioesterase